jgi:SET domain
MLMTVDGLLYLSIRYSMFLLGYSTFSLTLALFLNRGRVNLRVRQQHQQQLSQTSFKPNGITSHRVVTRRQTTCWRHFRHASMLAVDYVDRENVPAREKYDRLLSWLRSKCATVNPKLSLQPSTRIGGGYGAFVSEAAEAGEVMFMIPREACITLSDALNDKPCGTSFKQLIEKAGPGASTVALAGYLARERLKALHEQTLDATIGSNDREGERKTGGSPSYAPYLETLPWARGVNNQEHILFWSDDEIEQYLKGTMCYSETVSLRQEVELATTVLNRIIGKSVREHRGETGGSEASDTSAFKWPWQIAQEKADENARLDKVVDGLPEAVTGAFVCLLTRSFQEDVDGTSNGQEKLVPLLDMLQHSDVPNVSHSTKYGSEDYGTVVVIARRRIEAGEELLNQYRPELEESMPYHRFFSRFGFVPGIEEPIVNLLRDKSPIFVAQTAEI